MTANANGEQFLVVSPDKPQKLDFTHHEFPSTVEWKDGKSSVQLGDNATHFIFCTAGSIAVKNGGKTYALDQDCYGCFNDATKVEGDGTALISSRIGYRGITQVGGPAEEKGRLKYIDGCSSTVLIAPLKKGDPCFNFLHIPPHARQAMHTHPSLRVCYVVEGTCFVTLADNKEVCAKAGGFICIEPDTVHSFHTEDDGMRIVVYHPDSEVGPCDEEHPMLNRTLIEGVPAHILWKQQQEQH